MKKIYLPLLKEQKERKVLFSSTLSKYKFETEEDTRHDQDEELFFKDCAEFTRREELLKDDSFFDASHFKYNIIRS